MADYFTKHHTTKHHQTLHPNYLHLEHIASNLIHHANHKGVLSSIIGHKPIGMMKAHNTQQVTPREHAIVICSEEWDVPTQVNFGH